MMLFSLPSHDTTSAGGSGLWFYTALQSCRAALAALVTYMHVDALDDKFIIFEGVGGVTQAAAPALMLRLGQSAFP